MKAPLLRAVVLVCCRAGLTESTRCTYQDPDCPVISPGAPAFDAEPTSFLTICFLLGLAEACLFAGAYGGRGAAHPVYVSNSVRHQRGCRVVQPAAGFR
jgi:hypothetical protein